MAACLVGEPGIGKSRLAYEFRANAGIAERVEGAALSHARLVTYFVVRQLLRELACIAPSDDLAEVRNQLHRHLWDLSPTLAALTPDIFAVLGGAEEAREVPGAPLDERRERVHNAVSAWISAECRRAPKMLLVEDLQWLDPSSEALLARLVREASKLPLLIVTTSRYSIAGTKLEIEGIREIFLSALATADIYALVDSQLEPYAATDRLRRLVAERSEGNPFYVEELIRNFRERSELVLERGAYELRPSAENVVPPTISALIASRIDRLPESAREQLADAAALGKEFPLACLRMLSSPEHFEDDLSQIERRGFLDRQAGGGIEMLAFRHVLIQEVAYGSLMQSDRQLRHRRAAMMLEGLYHGRTHEVCDQLTHHWLVSDRPAQALSYLMEAAEAAAAIGSIREAIAHLETAVPLCAGQAAGDQSPAAAIRLKLAGLHFIGGE